MATSLTGRFEADFSNFNTAVDGAQIKLRSFEDNSGKVANALKRMTDSFSGQNVIQQATLMVEAVERLGGTAVLTEKELQRLAPTVNEAVLKMQKMGLEVPANLAAIAKETQNVGDSMFSMGGIAKSLAGPLAAVFSVQAVINFADQVLTAGDAIQKMADQTSLTTDEVQQLQYITGQAGSSMESLVSAVQNVQVQLGSGDAGVTGALGRMNIKLEDFKRLDSYEQMLQLSEGLRAIKDPTEQAAVAADLFKLKWKELLPTLKSDMRALGDEAPRMSAQAVAGLDALGDAMTAAKQRAIAETGEWVNAAMRFGSDLADLYQKFDTAHLGQTNAEAADPFGLKASKAALEEIPAAQEVVAEGYRHITVTAKEAAAMAEKFSAEVTANLDRRAAANKAIRDGMIADAEAANKAYWAGVEKLIDDALGSLSAKLTTAYQWSDAMERLNNDVSKLSGTMRGELAAAMQGGIAAMAAAGTLTQDQSTRYAQLLAAVDAYNQTLRSTVSVTIDANGTVTAYTQALYDAALAEDAQRVAAAGKNDELDRTRQAADAAAEALSRQYSLMQSMPTPESLAKAAMNPGSMLGFGLPSSFLTSGGGLSLSGIAPRAAGGPVMAGATYLVGERGPELFTSGSGGMITPLGGTVVNNVFHIVDTEANLARRVSDAIARTITQARKV